MVGIENDKSEKKENDLREQITAMATKLSHEQLITIVDAMRIPYLTQQMKAYLVDKELPKLDSPEFKFLDLAAQHNGTITKVAAHEAGISSYSFYKFIDKYPVNEIVKGIYVFKGKPIDGLYLFQLQYSKAVVSHESALYYLGLSDVILKEKRMSMPQNYKLTQLVEANDAHTPFRDVYTATEWKAIGNSIYIVYKDNDPIKVISNRPIPENQIRYVDSGFGHMIKITSMERSLADILSTKAKTEDEIKETALRRYFEQPDANRNRLRRIAKEQKVLKALDQCLLEYKL